MLARILALLVFTGFLLLPIPVFAQTATSSALPTSNLQPQYPASNFQLPTSISPTSPLYTDLLVNNLFHTFSCLAVGQSLIGQPCLTYQFTKNAQGLVQGVPILSQANLSGGTLGAVASIMDGLYLNPPVRTADYLASVKDGFGIVREARAQVVGSGEAVLHPILSLWQVSRNVSYVIMILIFLVIGLMIMFRNKINPQTVITVQAAIPGLIIGLILITFSYFLAGLLSDMAFVGTNIVGYFFSAAQGNVNPPQNLLEDLSKDNVLTVFSRFVGVITAGDILAAVETVFNSVGPEVQNFIRFAAGAMAFSTGNQLGHIVPVIGDVVGIFTGAAVSLAAGLFPPQIISLVLSWVSMAILVYSMIKLLLNLIKNYLTIIFLTITAPFHFLAASLPGRQSIATGWILNMLCNILAFPAVLAVFYFVAYVLNLDRPPFKVPSSTVQLISPQTFPLLGGVDVHFINILLAFGALVALPAIPGIICRAVGRAGAAGQLLGQELSGNIQGGRGYSNQWQQAGGAVGKMGQDWSTFRGKPIGYSPALEYEKKGLRIFGKTIIGEPKKMPSWASARSKEKWAREGT